MRPAVLKGLKVLIESNVTLQDPDKESTPAKSITAGQAAQNVEFLRGQADSWLAVLFNVFSSAENDNRNTVGEVISAWASIAKETVRCRDTLKLLNE
jgi:ribosomal RNA-processing protein 12